MTIDFRASQIQTVKIISSGSTGTNAKILIYDIAADGTNQNQGEINPAVFSTGSIGEDIFLFISGWSGSLGTGTQGATVFGGDVKVSGTLIVEGSASIQGLGSGGGVVSGTNFGTGSAVHTSVSSSTTLNFRTIQGIGGVVTSINGNILEVSAAAGAATVSSVFGRVGAVVAAANDYAASEVENDCTSVQGATVSAALDTLNTGVSASLTTVSGTNFGAGTATLNTSVSSSNTLNFFTLSGSGGIVVTNSGDIVDISGSVGGGGAVDSVFGRTGAVVAAASDYDASQVDNDSNVVGSFVDDALNTLSASNTTLSGVVATDINSVESDISTNSSAITTLSGVVATDINTISSSLYYLSASDIFNDSTSIQGATVSAALDTLNTGVSASLTSVSGTNFGGRIELYSSVSGSTFNFRTLSGSGDIAVVQSGDVVTISSSNATVVIASAASIELNLSSSTIFRYELSQNTSISMSNNWDGATGILRLKHDGTANSYAVTWSSQFRQMDSENLNPTQASGAIDIYSFFVDEELVHISKAPNWVPVT
jgi:hypothetical protein